jgi:hypothetical protein
MPAKSGMGADGADVAGGATTAAQKQRAMDVADAILMAESSRAIRILLRL